LVAFFFAKGLSSSELVASFFVLDLGCDEAVLDRGFGAAVFLARGLSESESESDALEAAFLGGALPFLLASGASSSEERPESDV
jgi:hypothetical protein